MANANAHHPVTSWSRFIVTSVGFIHDYRTNVFLIGDVVDTHESLHIPTIQISFISRPGVYRCVRTGGFAVRVIDEKFIAVINFNGGGETLKRIAPAKLGLARVARYPRDSGVSGHNGQCRRSGRPIGKAFFKLCIEIGECSVGIQVIMKTDIHG